MPFNLFLAEMWFMYIWIPAMCLCHHPPKLLDYVAHFQTSLTEGQTW